MAINTRVTVPKPGTKYYEPTIDMFENFESTCGSLSRILNLNDRNFEHITIPPLDVEELPALEVRLQKLKTDVSEIMEAFKNRQTTALEWISHVQHQVVRLVDHLMRNDSQTTELSDVKKIDFRKYSDGIMYVMKCLLDDLAELKWFFNDIIESSELFPINKHSYDRFSTENIRDDAFLVQRYKVAIEETESAVFHFQGLGNNLKSPVNSLIELLNKMVEENIRFESGIVKKITIQNGDPVKPADFGIRVYYAST